MDTKVTITIDCGNAAFFESSDELVTILRRIADGFAFGCVAESQSDSNGNRVGTTIVGADIPFYGSNLVELTA